VSSSSGNGSFGLCLNAGGADQIVVEEGTDQHSQRKRLSDPQVRSAALRVLERDALSEHRLILYQHKQIYSLSVLHQGGGFR